jgi:hypothetical protein
MKTSKVGKIHRLFRRIGLGIICLAGLDVLLETLFSLNMFEFGQYVGGPETDGMLLIIVGYLIFRIADGSKAYR